MRVFILAALSLVALFVSIPRAHAGTLICKSHYTDSDDRDRLRAAMQRVLPPDVPMEGIPDLCRNRRSAHAWLSTPAHLRSDGVTEWWRITCARESRDWTCSAPEHGQLVWVYAEVGGMVRRLEVSFDDATALAQARRWAVRAIQIIQDASSAPLPACGYQASDERQREWEKKQRANALTPADTVIELTVDSDEAGAVHVTKDDLGLTFTDGSREPTTGARACWVELIVIA